MRRLVRSRSFDVITCPAVHRGAGRLPPFATVVRVARIGVSIFSLEQKKKKFLSSLSALVLRTSGILFFYAIQVAPAVRTGPADVEG